MPLPREYISHSQIRTYSDCPLRYYFAYIEEIPQPINDKILLGQVFHSAIEHYFIQRINRIEIGPEEIIEVFDRQFDSLQAERDIVWKDTPRETRERGLAFVRFFLSQIGPAIKPLKVEEELTVEIPQTGIRLKGVIDLVEDDFSITDFKTSTSRWNGSRARNSLQMIIYKYLFDRTYGGVNSTIRFEILYSKNASNIKRQTLRVVPGEEEIAQMLEVVIHIADNISRGIFYRKENYTCPYCEYRELCRTKRFPVPDGMVHPD
jgi:CRISPR/Cas system-associated exonuclease Cas4 (RecB family)